MSYDELLNRVNSWHDRANQEEEDYFVKFIFDYLAFAALICYKNYGNKTDRQLIQKLKRSEQIKRKYYKIANKKVIEDLIKELEANPLTNETYKDKYWDCDLDQCPHERSSNDGKIKSVDDFKNIVEFIYRARNNLFHGKKGIDYGRDSKIVKYGFYLLNPLVDILIESKGRIE